MPDGRRHNDMLRSWRLMRLRDLVDAETGWYRRWYFLARLHDEIAAARKARRELTLICIRLPLSEWGEDSRLRIYATVRLGLIEREESKANAIFGRVSQDEFAVCVKHTDGVSGSEAAAEIESRLRAIAGATGFAVLPAIPMDGFDDSSLLDAARDSLKAQSPSNLVYLDEYRRRRRPSAA